MSKGKVLITDKVHQMLPESLEKMGYEVIYDKGMDNEKLQHIIHDLTGVIINSKMTLHADMIDLGKNLKFISRLGSGMEIVDIPYAQSKGISVISTPEGNCDSVAEHAIGMLLSLNHNLCKANHEVRQHKWDREGNRGYEIGGKTIGIIGIGHTGSAFARKIRGFGTKVLAHDKYKKKLSQDLDHVALVSLQDILREADIITLHLPLTEETRHYVDSSFIASCKNDVVIINTSRGHVVKTSSLIDGLQSGKVRGACLDVFENEKPKTYTAEEHALFSRLHSYSNVMLSPHVAGWTHESLYKIAQITLDRINQCLVSDDKNLIT